MFQKAIDKAEPAEEVKLRVNNLIDCITFSVFIYTTRGLFEKDKLIFTAQVAFQVWNLLQINILFYTKINITGYENKDFDHQGKELSRLNAKFYQGKLSRRTTNINNVSIKGNFWGRRKSFKPAAVLPNKVLYNMLCWNTKNVGTFFLFTSVKRWDWNLSEKSWNWTSWELSIISNQFLPFYADSTDEKRDRTPWAGIPSSFPSSYERNQPRRLPQQSLLGRNQGKFKKKKHLASLRIGSFFTAGKKSVSQAIRARSW